MDEDRQPAWLVYTGQGRNFNMKMVSPLEDHVVAWFARHDMKNARAQQAQDFGARLTDWVAHHPGVALPEEVVKAGRPWERLLLWLKAGRLNPDPRQSGEMPPLVLY